MSVVNALVILGGAVYALALFAFCRHAFAGQKHDNEDGAPVCMVDVADVMAAAAPSPLVEDTTT